MKTATKMLAAILVVALVAGAHAIPVDVPLVKEQPAVLQQEPLQPKPVESAPSTPVLPIQPPKESPNDDLQPGVGLPPPAAAIPAGGAPPPGDLAESPDANPAEQPGTSDLDTDSTFWGGYGYGGYRRPYYGGWGYSSPWRRWGGYGYGGRGYGGWGWGGRGGWGWGGGYWG